MPNSPKKEHAEDPSLLNEKSDSGTDLAHEIASHIASQSTQFVVQIDRARNAQYWLRVAGSLWGIHEQQRVFEAKVDLTATLEGLSEPDKKIIMKNLMRPNMVTQDGNPIGSKLKFNIEGILKGLSPQGSNRALNNIIISSIPPSLPDRMEIIYQELFNIYRAKGGPLLQALLPKQIVFWDMNTVDFEIFLDDQKKFNHLKKTFNDLTKLSPKIAKNISGGTVTLIVLSAATMGLSIATSKSDNLADAIAHEGTLLVSSLGGGWYGGILGAAAASAICGPGAPLCALAIVIGSGALGSYVGHEFGELYWKATKSLGEFINTGIRDHLSGGAQLSDHLSLGLVSTVNAAPPPKEKQGIEASYTEFKPSAPPITTVCKAPTRPKFISANASEPYRKAEPEPASETAPIKAGTKPAITEMVLANGRVIKFDQNKEEEKPTEKQEKPKKTAKPTASSAKAAFSPGTLAKTPNPSHSQVNNNESHQHKWYVQAMHEIGEFTALAHSAKIHLPKTLDWLGNICTMGAAICHHPDMPMVENTLCNGGMTLLKEMMDLTIAVTIAGGVGAGALAAGASLTVAVPVSAVVAIAAFKIVKKTSDPVIAAMQKCCYKTFDLLHENGITNHQSLSEYILESFDEDYDDEFLEHKDYRKNITKDDIEKAKKFIEEMQQKKEAIVGEALVSENTTKPVKNTPKQEPIKLANLQRSRSKSSIFSFSAHAASMPVFKPQHSNPSSKEHIDFSNKTTEENDVGSPGMIITVHPTKKLNPHLFGISASLPVQETDKTTPTLGGNQLHKTINHPKTRKDEAAIKILSQTSAQVFFQARESETQLLGQKGSKEKTKALVEKAKSHIAQDFKKFTSEKPTAAELLLFCKEYNKAFDFEAEPFFEKQCRDSRDTDSRKQFKKEFIEEVQKQLPEAVALLSSEGLNTQEIDRLVLNLLTDIDISGFEHKPEIRRLKQELEAFKESPSATPLQIFQAAQALNKAKAQEAAELRRKEEFVSDAHYCVDIASKLASLFGHSKTGNQIAAVGSALINAGVFAAGMMSPLAYASCLLGDCLSIKSLFGRKKGQDSSQMIMDALRVFSEQLQLLLNERFNEVMEFLKDERGLIIRGFLSLQWDSDTIYEQIQNLHLQTKNQAERQATLGKTLLTKIDHLRRTIESQSQVREVTDLLTMTKTAMNDHESQKRYAQYTAQVETAALEPDLGARHVNIAGKTALTSTKDLPAFLELITNNDLHHRQGYFALNTLLSYLHNLNLSTDYYYSEDSMNSILQDIVKNREEIACSSILGFGHLLINDPDLGERPGIHPISLRKLMKNFDEKGFAIQIFPIQYNGSWHLFVVDYRSKTYHYFGAAETVLVERLQVIIDGFKDKGLWKTEIHACVLEPGLGFDATALLLIKQCSQIVEQNAVVAATNVDTSFTLSKDEAESLHDNYREKYEFLQEQEYVASANPLAWQYLSYVLDHLVYKQYPDMDQACLSTIEIARMQKFINEGSTIISQLNRLCNDKFLKRIVKNYEQAASDLSKAIEENRKDFEKRTSGEMTVAIKRILGKTLFDTSMFASQSFHVKPSYGHWFFYTGYRHTHGKKGNGPVQGHDAAQIHAHVSNRETYLKGESTAFINRAAVQRNKGNLFCNLDLHEGTIETSWQLPVCIYPEPNAMAATAPILPMPFGEDFKALVPDTFYIAQMLGLEKIELLYMITKDEFLLGASFCTNTKNKIFFSELSVPFDKQFYDENEAIEDLWFGGSYCDSLDVKGVFSKFENSAERWHEDRTLYLPTYSEHTGLYHSLHEHIEKVQFFDTKEERLLEKEIFKIIAHERAKWYSELQSSMDDSCSSFGKAVANFEACAKILSLLSQIVLVQEEGSHAVQHLITQNPTLAFDKAGLNHLLTLLASQPNKDLTKLIAPKENTTAFLKNVLDLLQALRTNPNYPFFNGAKVINDLLKCMDSYVKRMEIKSTITQKEKQQRQLSEASGRALMFFAQGLEELSNADPLTMKAGLEKLARKAKQSCAMHAELSSKIAAGSDFIAPQFLLAEEKQSATETSPGSGSKLTGYNQHGLLGANRSSVSEVKASPPAVKRKEKSLSIEVASSSLQTGLGNA